MKTDTNTQHTALVDMDGTICDLDEAVIRELGRLRSPGEPHFSHGDVYPDWIENRRNMVMRQPGFWLGLNPLPLGFEIVKVLEDAGFGIHVLTKGPSSKPLAWGEKVQWVRGRLPQAGITVTEDKSNYYGRVLVDDWKDYGMGWLKNRKRGLLIVPAQPWNVGAEDWHPNVFRYSGKQPERLAEVVRIAFNRTSEQPLILPFRSG